MSTWFKQNIDFYIKNNSNYPFPNPIPSILKPRKRIIAVGDIHGDLSALIYSLYISKVVDKSGNWIGFNTVVVQMGDLIDKKRFNNNLNNSNDSLEEIRIIDFLNNLHLKALKFGGCVLRVIGNHEIMNIMGDFSYVLPYHLNGFKGNNIRKKLFQPGGILAKKIMTNSNAIIQIGNWVFVHAGLLPFHLNDYNIEQINFIVRNYILGKIKFQDIKPELREIIFGVNGFLWNRELTMNINESKKKNLYDLLNKINIDLTREGGMVVGHTVNKDINHKYNKKLWTIDTGMSIAFGQKKKIGDRVQVLEIIDDGKIINIIKSKE